MSKKLGKGVLFTNTFKDKNDQPDMRGEVTVNGVKMQIAGWEQKDKNDNPMYSLAISEKFEKSAT